LSSRSQSNNGFVPAPHLTGVTTLLANKVDIGHGGMGTGGLAYTDANFVLIGNINAGANPLSAEMGANPRDTTEKTVISASL